METLFGLALLIDSGYALAGLATLAGRMTDSPDDVLHFYIAAIRAARR